MYIPTSQEESDQYLRILLKLDEQNNDLGWKGKTELPINNSPNYEAPHCGQTLLAVALLTIVLATAMVSSRLYARFFYVKRRLELDDWLLISAIVFSIILSAIYCQGVVRAEVGYHIWDIKIESMTTALKLIFTAEIIYIIALYLTKITFILQIRRKSHGGMIKISNGFIIAHILLAFTSLLGVGLQCMPPSAAYDLWVKISSRCSNMSILTAFGSLDVVSNCALLILPIKLVLEHKMSRNIKLCYAGLYGLGMIAFISGILHTVFLSHSATKSDFSWNFVNVAIFAQLEITLIIIAICIPSLRILWDHARQEITGWNPRAQLSKASERDSSIIDKDPYMTAGVGAGPSSARASATNTTTTTAVSNINDNNNVTNPTTTTVATEGFHPAAQEDVETSSPRAPKFSDVEAPASGQGARIYAPRHIAELQIRAIEDKAVIRPGNDKMRNIDFAVKTNLPPEAIAVAAMAAGRVSTPVPSNNNVYSSTDQTSQSDGDSSSSEEIEPSSPSRQYHDHHHPPSPTCTAMSVRTSFSTEYGFPMQSGKSEDGGNGNRNMSLSPMPPLPPLPPLPMVFPTHKDSKPPKLHLRF